MAGQNINFDSQNPVVYDITTREVIQVMPDTLDNKLRDFENSLQGKGNIYNDVGLSVALLVTLVTVSEFRTFLGIKPEVWQAIFVVLFLFSFFKLCSDTYEHYSSKKMNRKQLLADLLDVSRRKKAR